MYFEWFNTLGSTGFPGPTGRIGATGPRGRTMNEVNTDCEGPVGESRRQATLSNIHRRWQFNLNCAP